MILTDGAGQGADPEPGEGGLPVLPSGDVNGPPCPEPELAASMLKELLQTGLDPHVAAEQLDRAAKVDGHCARTQSGQRRRVTPGSTPPVDFFTPAILRCKNSAPT